MFRSTICAVTLVLIASMSLAAMAVVSMAAGNDTLPAGIAVTEEQRSKLQADPVVKKLDSAFETEIRAAEVAYANAKRKAKEKRLTGYRDQLKAFTKAGEFDKAVACKQALTAFENDDETEAPRATNIPTDAIPHNGRWYWFSNHKAKFADAKKQAMAMKGKLACPESAAENDFFVEHVRGQTYLGLVHRGKDWMNTDDKKQKYFKWKAGEPTNGNEDFLVMELDGDWFDFNEAEFFFVVEWGRK